jgi:hypothetical protein
MHHEVGAQLERPLDQRRGQRAVDHHQRARLARSGADGRQAGDRQQWVGRRLEPQQVGVAGQVEPAPRVLDADACHAPPPLPDPGGGKTRDTLVAVVGEHHGRAGREEVEHRRDGAHA